MGEKGGGCVEGMLNMCCERREKELATVDGKVDCWWQISNAEVILLGLEEVLRGSFYGKLE